MKNEILAATLWTIIGINDDQDTCDCCGKKNLKKVVWMENTDTHETAAFGTTCATRAKKVTVKVQKEDEKAFVEACKTTAFEELKPFTSLRDAAMAAAPNHLTDKSLTLKDRLNWINNEPRIKAYRAKVEELNSRWGFRVIN